MFVTNNYPTSPVEVALAEFSLEVPIKSHKTCWKVSASDTKHWCPGITILNQINAFFVVIWSSSFFEYWRSFDNPRFPNPQVLGQRWCVDRAGCIIGGFGSAPCPSSGSGEGSVACWQSGFWHLGYLVIGCECSEMNTMITIILIAFITAGSCDGSKRHVIGKIQLDLQYYIVKPR